MTDPRNPPSNAQGIPANDPRDPATADPPMTPAQRARLDTLSGEAGAPLEPTLTEAQGARRIEEFKQLAARRASPGTSASPLDPDAASDAGEEDPGASLGEAGTQNAMQGESRVAGGGR